MADNHIDRRRMLGMLGPSAALVVAGFDSVGRRWISQAAATGCPSFADAPPLDGGPSARCGIARRRRHRQGQYRLAHAVRGAAAGDRCETSERMIRYCRRYDLEVAVRGQGHTMHGQSLSSGLVIENGSLEPDPFSQPPWGGCGRGRALEGPGDRCRRAWTDASGSDRIHQPVDWRHAVGRRRFGPELCGGPGRSCAGARGRDRRGPSQAMLEASSTGICSTRCWPDSDSAASSPG